MEKFIELLKDVNFQTFAGIIVTISIIVGSMLAYAIISNTNETKLNIARIEGGMEQVLEFNGSENPRWQFSDRCSE